MFATVFDEREERYTAMIYSSAKKYDYLKIIMKTNTYNQAFREAQRLNLMKEDKTNE